MGCRCQTHLLTFVSHSLGKVFAQEPGHSAAAIPSIVPIFAGHEKSIRVRARDLADQKQKDSYIMPLKQEQRRAHDSPAVVQSFKDFRTNFNVFSESSLVDLKWDNVVAAGSSVVTSLLAVPEKHSGSKRALREYYHEQLAPASDVSNLTLRISLHASTPSSYHATKDAY